MTCQYLSSGGNNISTADKYIKKYTQVSELLILSQERKRSNFQKVSLKPLAKSNPHVVRIKEKGGGEKRDIVREFEVKLNTLVEIGISAVL